MARLLQDRDSSALHLNLARRHQRLARRYRLAGFATAIEPLVAALKAKAGVTEEKDFERQAAYDEVLAADGVQDDAVRNVFDAAKIFDREHPGAPALLTLFPTGGYGDLVDEPLTKQPADVDALAVRVESLGAAHALSGHAAKLRAGAAGVRITLDALDTAVRALKGAEAEEELAQAALRRQYEGNYLDARKSPGRPLAERLFPSSRIPAAPGTDPTPVPTPA